jgi:hypothetical protein
MEISEFQQLISQKTENSSQLAAAAAEDPAMVEVLMAGLDSNNVSYKYKCFKIANLLSTQNPPALYPYFERFAALLDSRQNIPKWNAIDILANLTSTDKDDKFSSLYERFYRLFEEGSLITAAHVVESSALIAMNRPQNEKDITTNLLKVDSIPLPTAECRNILCGKIIQTFAKYLAVSSLRPAMLEFAHHNLQNRRSGTAKKARDFVKKFGPQDESTLKNGRKASIKRIL